MLGLQMGLPRMQDRWYVVAGKDGLTHWQCVYVNPYEMGVECVTTVDSDETTYCGQTFFNRMPLPPSDVAITCLECCAREVP